MLAAGLEACAPATLFLPEGSSEPHQCEHKAQQENPHGHGQVFGASGKREVSPAPAPPTARAPPASLCQCQHPGRSLLRSARGIPETTHPLAHGPLKASR
ncbi:hypothetical protein E2C01_005897 [Portunus trituberculatus]|uniref:Uncharacterized protein n=1 Tax=Portunus trituberculatus TaxID=210409 RepID=A0A5B7CXT6_PORTR|nr:hypothetical protein [Portunus trituberculatus]